MHSEPHAGKCLHMWMGIQESVGPQFFFGHLCLLVFFPSIYPAFQSKARSIKCRLQQCTTCAREPLFKLEGNLQLVRGIHAAKFYFLSVPYVSFLV